MKKQASKKSAPAKQAVWSKQCEASEWVSTTNKQVNRQANGTILYSLHVHSKIIQLNVHTFCEDVFEWTILGYFASVHASIFLGCFGGVWMHYFDIFSTVNNIICHRRSFLLHQTISHWFFFFVPRRCPGFPTTVLSIKGAQSVAESSFQTVLF